jgi:apolipoprotein D and lipocalin family protein
VEPILLSLAMLATAARAPADESTPPTTVARVDLARYVGLWHEIARIPNRFQKQCVSDVTATYALRDDGRIDVVNRCRRGDGRTSESKGLARVEDAVTAARLKVSFFSILGWRPVWGDYWVIGLGDDYEYAVVGTPSRKYGWILARAPRLDEATLERIFKLLRAQGYDPGRFEITPPEGG